jgi:hypothetical protein
MSDLSTLELEQLDTASTVRLPLRKTVLAQIEAALMAETLSLSLPEDQARLRGIDPYNRAGSAQDTWARHRYRQPDLRQTAPGPRLELPDEGQAGHGYQRRSPGHGCQKWPEFSREAVMKLRQEQVYDQGHGQAHKQRHG